MCDVWDLTDGYYLPFRFSHRLLFRIYSLAFLKTQHEIQICLGKFVRVCLHFSYPLNLHTWKPTSNKRQRNYAELKIKYHQRIKVTKRKTNSNGKHLKYCGRMNSGRWFFFIFHFLFDDGIFDTGQNDYGHCFHSIRIICVFFLWFYHFFPFYVFISHS